MKKVFRVLSTSLILQFGFASVGYASLVLDEAVHLSKHSVKKKEFTSSARIITAEELKNNNIKELSDLGRLVPSLKINKRSNDAYTSYSLRGMGDNDFYSPSLVIYVDGVAQDSTVAPSLINVKRIEILKGPQPSLYGKNSYSGVINIITNEPKNNSTVYAKTSISERGNVVDLNISQPLIEDKLYSMILIRKAEDSGTATKRSKENDSLSANLKYAPDNNPLNVSFSYTSHDKKFKEGFFNSSTWKEGKKPYMYDTGKIQSRQSTLKASYDYSNYKLTSITSIQKRDMDRILVFKQNEGTKTTSQEIIVNYNSPDKLMSSVFGFYYSDDKFERDSISYTGGYGTSEGRALANTENPHVVNVDTKSYSLYGETSYTVNSAVKVTAGGRIIKDKVAFKAREFNEDLSHNENLDANTKFTSFLPKVGLTYDWGGNVTQYATISRGYKLGGFNRALVQQYTVNAYKPEYSVNYETGIRYDTPNKDFSFDGSLYYATMKNAHFFDGNPGSQILVNKNSKSYGLDLNATIRKVENVDFVVGVQYNKSFIDESARRKDAPVAPVFSGNFIARHYMDMSKFKLQGDLVTNLSVSYNGKSYLNLANTHSQSAYTLVNLRTTYKLGILSLSLFADNLFDKAYKAYANGTTSREYIQPGKRRNIGIELGYNYKF